MTKDDILKECFERVYKGIKFQYFEEFKKGSKQYALLSEAFDIIKSQPQEAKGTKT